MGERLDAQELRFLRQDIEAAASIVSRIGKRVSELEDELRARRADDLSAADLALIDTALGHLASDVPPYDRAPKAGEVEALRAKLTKGAR